MPVHSRPLCPPSCPYSQNPVLELRVPEFVPDSFGNAAAIVDQAIAFDILANVLDIAGQQEAGVGVETRIDGLWEVNGLRLALPVQHIVR